MWLVLAVALFTADTRLYNSGCAPLDTASAVVPLAEFRSVIAHLEERKSLLVELATCQDLTALQTKQVQRVKREATTRGFWRGLATGVALSATLSLLMAIAVR